jgi:hypothetical protein
MLVNLCGCDPATRPIRRARSIAATSASARAFFLQCPPRVGRDGGRFEHLSNITAGFRPAAMPSWTSEDIGNSFWSELLQVTLEAIPSRSSAPQAEHASSALLFL